MAWRPNPTPPLWDSNVTTETITIGISGAATVLAASDDYHMIFSAKDASDDIVLGSNETGEQGYGVILEDGAGGTRVYETDVSPGTTIRITGTNTDVVYLARFKNGTDG